MEKHKRKSILISISLTPDEKDFLDKKGLSPTALLKESILNFHKLNNNSAIKNKVERDIEILRKYYIDSIKPDGDVKLYFRAIELFLKKYPEWTKAEVMARAERFKFYNVPEQKEELNDGL